MNADVPVASTAARDTPLVTTELRDGIAILTLDDPASTVVTTTPALVARFGAALDRANADRNARAIVIRSAKPATFVVGANVGLLRAFRFAEDAEHAARDVARLFARLASGPKPTVAYVHGPALGGGFELALACTACVATDDVRTTLGLPEVRLGLVPAGGGLFRVAERAGLRVALELGVGGRPVSPARALRLGLLDEVVAESIGLASALALARALADDPKRGTRRSRVSLPRALVERNPIGRAVLFRRARAETARTSRGHYPAAERVIDLLERWASRGLRSATELEAHVFGDLVVSETAHRLIDLFAAQTELKKDAGLAPGEIATPAAVERVAVVGAGLMGAGIAATSAQAGLLVRMKDADPVAVGRGLRHVKSIVDARFRRGATSEVERDATFARVTAATSYAGFRAVDLVVEAVFEDLALKHRVLRDVEAVVRDECVLASNTSSLPIARIAEVLKRPERLVGMHYSSPVERMPLLEVVRTPLTDPRAVATAVAVGKRQGKTVIVVADGPGFFTTRILVPYLHEAVHLLTDGSAIDTVDAGLVAWGFPIGPFRLMDEVGLDLTANVSQVTESAFGDRMRAPRAYGALKADDRRGRKNARGFYLYGSAAPRTKTVDPTVYGVLGAAPRPRSASADEAALRCVVALVNEAVRCLDEGIVRSPRDGDVGAVLGVGFPAFRGGPFRYVDAVGAPEILRRVRSLEQAYGARFAPAERLVDMARTGKRFYG